MAVCQGCIGLEGETDTRCWWAQVVTQRAVLSRCLHSAGERAAFRLAMGHRKALKNCTFSSRLAGPLGPEGLLPFGRDAHTRFDELSRGLIVIVIHAHEHVCCGMQARLKALRSLLKLCPFGGRAFVAHHVLRALAFVIQTHSQTLTRGLG